MDEALELCKEMELKGTMPNEVTYNSIIDVLCNEGRLVEAFRLFDAMERTCVTPTLTTYSKLIRGLCKEGYLEDAEELLKKLLELSQILIFTIY